MSTDRSFIGRTAAHIPFTAIDRYADRFGFHSRTDFELLFNVIRALDAKFLDIWRMKQQQQDQGRKTR